MQRSSISAYSDTRWFYETLRPMLPPPRLIDVWEQFEPVLDGIIKSFAPVIGIMTGYFMRDIRISVRDYNVLEKPKGRYIWFNLYWMQFLAELLEAGRCENESGFYALAHNCWRDLCDNSDPQQKDWHRYHEYRCRQFASIDLSEQTLQEASFGVLFIMLHETAHLTSDYRVLAEKLVNSDALCSSLPSFEPEELLTTEIACDYCALSLCLGSDTSSVLVPDANRRIEIILLSLSLSSLFDYLLNVAPIWASNVLMESARDGKTITDMLDARVKPLSVMAKISQNSKMSGFDGIDVAGQNAAAGELIVRFLQCVKEDLVLEPQFIKAYNGLEEHQKPTSQSRLASSSNIWTRHTFV